MRSRRKTSLFKTKLLITLWVALWVVLAVIMVGCIFYIESGVKPTETKNEVVIEAVETGETEKDYLLDIPLAEELQDELYEASQEFGVDYYTMIALIERETNFRNVFGDGGDSYGYCQIQPKWWSELMTEIGVTDLNVPEDNFRTACAIVEELTEKHQSIEGALVAYNQGSYNGRGTAYSRAIMANAENYRI